MLLQIVTEVKIALTNEDMTCRRKEYIEVAFWCHGGKQRSVAAARLAEHVLKVFFQDEISVPHTRHVMRPWWSWIPCQMTARQTRSLLAYITLFVFNVHVSCSC
jgi:hypothetical protein